MEILGTLQITNKIHIKTKTKFQREPDYEFDGIIESEGVLEMMPDGYGFYVRQITII